MPGEDENQAALERLYSELGQHSAIERAALEREIRRIAGDHMTSVREVADSFTKMRLALKADAGDQELAAMIEVLKAELAEDQEVAAKNGRTLNLDTINYRALAIDAIKRDKGLRRVEGWVHPPSPNGWFSKAEERGDVTSYYRNPAMSLLVGLSCEIEDDGRAWLHLSVSHRNRLPTWGELGKAKEAFLGDLEAYQVLPPRSRYVNIATKCLNIYAPLTGAILPDFTRGTGGI